MLHSKWVTKYRPTAIANYVFSDSKLEETVREIITQKKPRNLLFSGHHGTGKTALAFLLKEELGIEDYDFLKKNSSDENSVDMFRDEIKQFVEASPLGPFKIVFLDEADGLSNQAQKLMRGFVDEYDSRVMFIMTCNHPHKIAEPLRDSRFREYHFSSLDKIKAKQYLSNILDQENVKYDESTIDTFVETYHPDMRALIDRTEEASVTGTLEAPTHFDSFDNIKKLYHNDIHKTKDWTAIRDIACSVNNSVESWEHLFRFFYQECIPTHPNLDNASKKMSYMTTGEYLFRLGFMKSCPELTFVNYIIALSEV